MSKWFLGAVAVFVGLLMFGHSAHAALPANFQVTQIIGSGLNGPTGFGIAPDGRIFILERTGAVKIYKGGQLLPTPFAVLPSAGTGDRGLIGVAFDPNFLQNHFVYFYYTASDDLLNRLVRFEADGDVAVSAPVTIYQTRTPSQFLHSGGTVAFGLDGKLYLAIGDNGYPPNAQDLTNAHGKILRINADGTVPSDNPFVGQAGALPEIWAYGFRNPWRFQFDSVSGKLYAGDVGESTFEEINEVRRGQNYGWPICEGYCAQYTQPLHAYAHSGPSSAVTAGPVYRGSMFPTEYRGNFFFADYGQGFLRRAIFDNAGNISSVQDFDAGAGSVVDLHEALDGSLYYITYYPGRLYRINYSTGNHIPVAVASSDVTKGLDPLTVNFSSQGSFDPDNDPLQYTWDFGDGTTSSLANPSKTYQNKGTYVVELYVSDGASTAQAVPVVIQVGQAPTVAIGAPLDGQLYRAGDTIIFSGHGEDGAGIDLSDANFTTEVRFHHHDHIHPFYGPVQAKSGQFTIPTTGEPDPDTWYEIRVTGTDSNGLSTTAVANIYPRKSTISVLTNPPGLDIVLDGTLTRTPIQILGVSGFQREYSAPSQGQNNVYYVFDSWSDGGAATHTITFPDNDTTVTAHFIPGDGQCNAVGTNAFIGCYHANKALTDLRLVRTDAQINFTWGAGAPGAGLPVDDFSVRWSGDFTFEAGEYEFTTATDDGVLLYVDGVRVQDYWVEQSAVPHTNRMSLTAGTHRVVLEYFEAGGDASARLSWVKIGNPPAPVVNCNQPNTNSFNSCFFYQKDLTDFKLNRTDNYPLNFDWGGGSPDQIVPVDNFSASFLGQFDFAARDYTFTVAGDDGVRLYVDGVLVLDKWIDQPPTTYTLKKTITAGSHVIKLEYYENGGGAVAKLSWVADSVTPPPSTCEVLTQNAFTGCYYDNLDLTNLQVTRVDNYPLNFDWGGGSPDANITPDTFSARWQGDFAFNADDYAFTVIGDDGMRLSIDGVVVLDKFIDQPPTTYTVTKSMSAGTHRVMLEYYENGGGAVAKLSWAQLGTTPPLVNCAVPGTSAFTGCYYDDLDLTNLQVTRVDNYPLNFDWGLGSPDSKIGPDTFSARWQGNFQFEAGDYNFVITADDGVRLYVDGVLVLDKWIDQPATTYAVTRTLSAGAHLVVYEYYENGWDAVAKLSWTKTGNPPPPPPVATCPTTGALNAFTGCYYDNKDFTSFSFTRTDPQINFDFGSGSPAPTMGAEEFSVRWTGNFDLAAGTYTFTTTADDGVRVFVDGQVVIDKWLDQAATAYTASVPLTAGVYEVKMEYYENWGDAVAKLSWIKQ